MLLRRPTNHAALLACAAVACGRVGFEPSGTGGTDGDGGGSGTADARGNGIDGANDRPNVAFVTSATTTGAFGGIAGGDAMCATAATSAGLPGEFVALLSITGSLAWDRLGTSRGWIRTDGVPVADTIDDLIAGVMFNPLDRDETGARVTTTTSAWTGTTSTPAIAQEKCADWTTSSGFGNSGYIGGAMPELVVPLNVYITTCADLYALLCFEIGHDVVVGPNPTSGNRLAFLATSAMHGGGVGALDSQCQSEATAAGLPGTYLAAVAAQGVTIASRFGAGTPWARPDGTVIAPTTAAMFDGTDPDSFINQLADGTYAGAANTTVRTGELPLVPGTSNSTCNSWTSTSNSNGRTGRRIARSASMWGIYSTICTASMYTHCLQE